MTYRNILNQTLILFCTALNCTLLMSSCNSSTKGNVEEKRRITVSIEPLRYFTEAIAGPQWEVESLVPKGASPETYDPTPRQMARLSESKACLRIGYIGYELAWNKRLAENAPHVPFLNMSKGVDLIYGSHHHAHHGGEGHLNAHDTHEHHHDGEADCAGNYQEQEREGHHHADEIGVEPHIWNSTINARIIAGNVLKALISIDRKGAESYRARYDSLCQRIQRCDSLIREMLSKPEASQAFMIYHPALSYFARDYGLTQISIETDGKEPSAEKIKFLTDICHKEDVKVIFVQPEFDKRNAETIAQQADIQIIDINPLAYDWEEEMLSTARALSSKQP